MSIKSKYAVRSIDAFQCKDWFVHKHYIKKMPGSIVFAFGLYDEDNILIGVLSYGMSANSNLNEIGGCRVLELNRLCINDTCEKNTASFFISKTYKYLKEYILVSYADMKQGHHGYIYQALNWIYTGISEGGMILETENGIVHKRAYDQRSKKAKIISQSRSKKYRYFYVPSKNKR